MLDLHAKIGVQIALDNQLTAYGTLNKPQISPKMESEWTKIFALLDPLRKEDKTGAFVLKSAVHYPPLVTQRDMDSKTHNIEVIRSAQA